MKTDLLYIKDYVRIEYREEIKAIRIEWEGFVTTAEFIEAMNTALDWFVNKAAISFLVNQEKRKILPTEASEWFVNTWFPKLMKMVGINIKVAMIISSNLFGKMDVRRNISNIEKQNKEVTPYKYFDKEEDAYSWLKEWFENYEEK